MLDAERLIGLLAEPERRRVAAALILAGSDGSYVILESVFKAAAVSRSRASTGRAGPSAGGGAAGDVVERSIVDGRLVHLPRKRAKRLLVLDRLAQEFEPGTHYPEREVNRTLRRFDDDVATLRRYLVDEGFLDRADGEYWRSGGTFDLDGDRPG